MECAGQLNFQLQPLLEELDPEELQEFKTLLHLFVNQSVFKEQEIKQEEIKDADGKQLAEILINRCHSYWLEIIVIQILERMNRMDLASKAKEELRGEDFESLPGLRELETSKTKQHLNPFVTWKLQDQRRKGRDLERPKMKRWKSDWESQLFAKDAVVRAILEGAGHPGRCGPSWKVRAILEGAGHPGRCGPSWKVRAILEEPMKIEEEDLTNLAAEDSWVRKKPGQEDKYKKILKKKFWQIWKSHFFPGVLENISAATRRYEMHVPFCNPKTLTGPLPHTVVLYGPAGIGKTTLAKKVMLDWAEDNLAKTFKYTFFVSCKGLNHMGPCTCAELLCKTCPELQSGIVEMLTQAQNNILIVLDGFDELRFPPGALIRDICGDWKVQKPVPVLLSSLTKRKMFPQATLLITTRTWALRELRLLVEQPIFLEMEGFVESDMKAYFLKYFQDEDQAFQAFDLMQSNATLFSMGSAPMVCWVVSTCLKTQSAKGEATPSTFQTITSLYLYFLCSHFPKVPNSDSSQHLQSSLKAVCLLAAQGLWTQVSVFDDKDLEALDIKESDLGPFLEKNLLLKDKCSEGCYSFVHLSVQQFLTAIHYALENPEHGENGENTRRDIGKLKKLLSKGERLKNPTLVPVVYYLFGLSNEENSKELEKTFNCQVSKFKEEMLTWKLESESMPFSVMTIRDLFHCLYESQEEALVKKSLMYLTELHISLKNKTDLIHASFCLKHSRNLQWVSLQVEKGLFLESDEPLELDPNSLVSCSVDTQQWSDLFLTFKVNHSVICLTLTDDNLTDEGVKVLCTTLKFPGCTIERLFLENCNLTEVCCRDFSSTLAINQKLTHLCLAKHKLTDAGIQLLCDGISSPNCKLHTLVLWGCNVSAFNCVELSAVLRENRILDNLDLGHNALGHGGIKTLCEALKLPGCRMLKLRITVDDADVHTLKLLEEVKEVHPEMNIENDYQDYSRERPYSREFNV
ncbi:NACHT, LRR and PYD domains-containing protein 2 [Rhynchocyon petersi]